MSYTFLPYLEQARIRREYRIRVLIVLFFFISISLIIATGSLFPAYVYSHFEEKNHLSQVAAFRKTADAVAIKANQKTLSTSAGILDTLSGSIQPDIYYSTITSIVSLRGGVKLSSLGVEHPSPTVIKIALAGIATTRSDLLAFKTRLERGLPGTVAVDLPISTLAKDANIPFSIQVTETLK